jgi:hypothetical protein
MHFHSNRLPVCRVPRGAAAIRFRPASASEDRYSAFNGCFWRVGRPIEAALSCVIGGRGPPRRRSRPELQALSNSLQLTSN